MSSGAFGVVSMSVPEKQWCEPSARSMTMRVTGLDREEYLSD